MLRPLQPKKKICCDFARHKLGMLRPLQPKKDMLRFCTTQIRYVRPLQPKKDMLRFWATEKIYVAIMHDTKQWCCDHSDSKWVCKLERLKKFCETMLQLVHLTKVVLQFSATKKVCATSRDPGNICSARLHDREIPSWPLPGLYKTNWSTFSTQKFSPLLMSCVEIS